MAYLNLDLQYFSHPKTVRLVGILGESAALLPLKIWCYVGQFHCDNGHLEGYSIQEIESIAGWKGESGMMIDAMLKDGISLLEKIDGGYKVHDWLEHAGHLKAFKKRAKTAAKKRWNSYATSIAKRNLKHAPNLPNLPNLPNQDKKKKSPTHAMPDDWSLTDEMRAYGEQKGMTTATIQHEFEHCREHHRKNESRFTEKGWASSVWNTWVLNWVKFGSKQIEGPSAQAPQSKCAWANSPCECYAVPGSKYCTEHRDKLMKAIQAKVSGKSPGGEVVSIQTGELLSKIGRSM